MNAIVQHIFGNIFIERKISTIRLILFAEDCLNRLYAKNSKSQYSDIIYCLQSPLQEVKITTGKYFYNAYVEGEPITITKNQFLLLFKKTMIDSESPLTEALYQNHYTAYLEFYPHGVSEYSKANKFETSKLITRVYKSAEQCKELLNDDLRFNLQSFKLLLDNKKLNEEQCNIILKRKKARIDLEQALLIVIHKVAILNPGNAELGASFFDFNILFSKSAEKKDKVELSEILFYKILNKEK